MGSSRRAPECSPGKEPGSSRAVPRRKAFLFPVLAVATGPLLLLLVLALAEVGLRLAPSPPPAEPPARSRELLRCDKDSLLGWIFPPGAEGVFLRGPRAAVERTNRWGLRNPPVDGSAPDVTRILVLGDSYAFGWGVLEKEAFPRRLESMLRERWPDRAVEVVNGGIPGYSLYQQRALLERLLRDLRIDAVISTLSLANDMVDELRIRRFAPDRLVEYSPEPRDPRSLLSRMIGRSRALTWIDLRTRPWQFQCTNMCRQSVDDARDSLEQLVALCEERELPLLLLLVPRRVEIAASGPKAWIGRWMTRRGRAMHAGVARRHGLTAVDAGPALAAAQAAGSAFLPDDPHWTPRGHEAVAALLADELPPLLGFRESSRAPAP